MASYAEMVKAVNSEIRKVVKYVLDNPDRVVNVNALILELGGKHGANEKMVYKIIKRHQDQNPGLGLDEDELFFEKVKK